MLVKTDSGGRLVDAPAADVATERLLGELLAEADGGRGAIIAARVWARGREEGQAQMEDTLRRLGRRHIDLMQVHDLADFPTQIMTLRRWRAVGHARYIGATLDRLDALPAVEEVIRTARLDVVQVPYSIAVRAAEGRVLPAAADHGVAVLVSRPFGDDKVLHALRRLPLPTWAAEIECTTWPQILLKWILAHGAVTCVLPTTDDPGRMADFVAAGSGPLPDPGLRRQIRASVESA